MELLPDARCLWVRKSASIFAWRIFVLTVEGRRIEYAVDGTSRRRSLSAKAFGYRCVRKSCSEVICFALEHLEVEESFHQRGSKRSALDEKIDRALEQAAAGRVYGPDEAQSETSAFALRETHLADPG